MFNMSVRDTATLTKFLNAKVTELDKVLKEFDGNRDTGTLKHFMHWNVNELHRATVFADQATTYLNYLSKSDAAPEVTYDTVKNDVEHKIENMTMSFLTTSSNPAANAEKMYEMAFFLELKAAMKVY